MPTPPTSKSSVIALAAAPFAALAAVMVLRDGRPVGPDLTIHRWALEQRSPEVVTAARWLTDSGVGPFVVALTIVAGIALAGRGASLARRAGTVAFALGVILAGPLLRRAISILIERPRPEMANWITSPSGWAFPSGHTASATVVAVLLAAAFTHPGVRVLIALWAVGVGLTRIYLGVHWPTDVIGGWSFGIAWTGTALWLRSLHERSARTG